jgi:hypothetical protein
VIFPSDRVVSTLVEVPTLMIQPATVTSSNMPPGLRFPRQPAG